MTEEILEAWGGDQCHTEDFGVNLQTMKFICRGVYVLPPEASTYDPSEEEGRRRSHHSEWSH